MIPTLLIIESLLIIASLNIAVLSIAVLSIAVLSIAVLSIAVLSSHRTLPALIKAAPKRLRLALFAILVITSCQRLAAEEPAIKKRVDYLSEIKPLLAEKCYSCHGVLKQESDLRLDTAELMISGGAVVPADWDASSIAGRITSEGEDRMPPPEDGSALRPDEIDLLRTWVESGAEAPDEAIPAAPSEHWAFQPIQRAIGGNDNSPVSIDSLIDAKIKEHQLKIQPDAERRLQLRRLYLGLTGLPPNLQQQTDPRPWSEIADQLLDSQQYAENWARHWMDIWRYSDGYGLDAQLRHSQHHMWHWRDWIIESLRQDLGYDQMVMQMLAGDELEPANAQVVSATGFLARNYYLFNRTTWLDDTIEHTSKAFLGLTLNCAKCHDHKYDPLSQLDYYRFRAFFEPHQVRLDPVENTLDLEVDGLPRVFDDHLAAQTFLHRRGDPANPDQDHPLDPSVPALFAAQQPPITPVPLPLVAYQPGAMPFVGKAMLKKDQVAKASAEQELQELLQRKALLETQPPDREHEEEALFEFEDHFDDESKQNWTFEGLGWKYRDGKLVQTQITTSDNSAILNHPLPKDFEVVCRYTTTGGGTYKSVTFHFDESEDASNSSSVYSSAFKDDSKVQVSVTRMGNSIYPAEGRKGQTIEIGKTYQLKFAVRDKLVNVWLDNKFLLAYQLPNRVKGRFSLSGFDATVEFESLSIRELPASYELALPGNSEPMTVANSHRMVDLAQAKLQVETARLAATKAVIAANQAATSGSLDPQLRRSAATKQAELAVAEGEYQFLSVVDHDSEAAKNSAKKLEEARLKLTQINDQSDYQPFHASRKALETPEHKFEDYGSTFSAVSSGRRTALAQWIASAENPLTARVAVNHIWMRHFGIPLVEPVSDFGLRTAKPLHADVLDFLASELIESNWSQKHIHRLIVNSEAYRRQSSILDADPATLLADPENKYYWRMNSVRLESQMVRDSLLSLAKQLDSTCGGPSIPVGSDSRRRSVYFRHSRDDQDQFLGMFDDADHLQCYRRTNSIVPQQALALSNSKLSFEMASGIADTIEHTGEIEDFIAKAFRLLLARDATSAETKACLQFAEEISDHATNNDADLAADQITTLVKQRLIHVLLNHNDFITIR